MNDEQALERLRSGDLNALGWIYDVHLPGFLKTMESRHKCSKDQATDLFHDVLIDLCTSITRGGLVELYRGGLGGWLYTVGRNKWLGGYREGVTMNTYIGNMNLKPNEENENLQKREEDLERLQRCIEMLDEPCRTLIQRHHLDGVPLSHFWEEIGQTSFNAAKMALSRCRQKLKDLFFRNYPSA